MGTPLSNYRTICHVIYNSYLEEYPWVIAWLYSTIRLFHKCANNNYWKHIIQGLGGYFQDPGFDQNTVWNSRKLKISWGERDLTATWKEGYTGIWAQDVGVSCLFVRNSGYCTADAKQPGERTVVSTIKANYLNSRVTNRWADRGSKPTV